MLYETNFNRGEFSSQQIYDKWGIQTYDRRTFDRFHARKGRSYSLGGPSILDTWSTRKTLIYEAVLAILIKLNTCSLISCSCCCSFWTSLLLVSLVPLFNRPTTGTGVVLILWFMSRLLLGTGGGVGVGGGGAKTTIKHKFNNKILKENFEIKDVILYQFLHSKRWKEPLYQLRRDIEHIFSSTQRNLHEFTNILGYNILLQYPFQILGN